MKILPLNKLERSLKRADLSGETKALVGRNVTSTKQSSPITPNRECETSLSASRQRKMKKGLSRLRERQ